MIPLDIAELLRLTVLITTTLPEAIHNWPNAPRPKTPYAAIGINTMLQVGFGEPIDNNATDGDLDRKHSTLFDLTIGVDFFRPDAMLQASLLSRGLVRQDVVELWNMSGVGLVSRSGIRDLTTVINASFEDRAQVDITMQALITSPDEKVFGVDALRIIGDIHNHSGLIEHVHIGPP